MAYCCVESNSEFYTCSCSVVVNSGCPECRSPSTGLCSSLSTSLNLSLLRQCLCYCLSHSRSVAACLILFCDPVLLLRCLLDCTAVRRDLLSFLTRSHKKQKNFGSMGWSMSTCDGHSHCQGRKW